MNYGNWVPEKMLVLYWIISILTGGLYNVADIDDYIARRKTA